MARAEIWESVDGYEGIYEVSNHGAVRSMDRNIEFTHRTGHVVGYPVKGKVLTQRTDKYGYLQVNICNGGCRRVSVHRLVCRAFHGECPAECDQVAHADGDPSNNRADNLRWATATENTEDKRLHGRVLSGEAHPRAKLTHAQADEIRALRKRGVKYRIISQRYGVAISTISSIMGGKNWAEVANG